MSLIRFRPNPFSVFDNFFENELEPRNAATVPAVNVKENDTQFDLELAAPGLKKNDFHLSIDKDILTIDYETKVSNEEKSEDQKYHRREFRTESFKRSFTLPDTVDREQINAKYEDGILRLVLPKKEKKEASARIINIG